MTSSISAISPSLLTGAASAPQPKVHDAAQQFEALLLEQILQSARGGGGGWLGSGEEDAASDSATGFAEQQFANALARHGGLGIADLVAAGLTPEPATASGGSQ
ncbi:MAG TPA: hypothetical protein VGF59_06450 [Bryobacteraceae bacterium]|jgi:Rod binding domain-containing protein